MAKRKDEIERQNLVVATHSAQLTTTGWNILSVCLAILILPRDINTFNIQLFGLESSKSNLRQRKSCSTYEAWCIFGFNHFS